MGVLARLLRNRGEIADAPKINIRLARRKAWVTDGDDGGHRYATGLHFVHTSGEFAHYSDPEVLNIGLVRLKVAGVSYADPAVLRAVRPGDRVSLVAEPDNPYDNNAVAVRTQRGNLGHLTRGDAAHYCGAIDGKAALVLERFSLTKDGPACGLRIVMGPDSVVDFLLRRLATH